MLKGLCCRHVIMIVLWAHHHVGSQFALSKPEQKISMNKLSLTFIPLYLFGIISILLYLPCLTYFIYWNLHSYSFPGSTYKSLSLIDVHKQNVQQLSTGSFCARETQVMMMDSSYPLRSQVKMMSINLNTKWLLYCFDFSLFIIFDYFWI